MGVRVDVNEEVKLLGKLKKWGGGVGSGGGGVRGVWVGQGRCEGRSEVFVKIQKIYIFFFFGGGGGRVRDVGWLGSGWMWTKN